MTIKSLVYLSLLMATTMWPNIACDTNYKSSIITEDTDSAILTEDNKQDNSVLTKLMRENMCRKKLNLFVRELCRPYFRAERRLFCDNLFPLKSLSNSDRRNCRKSYTGDSMRRRSIGRMIKSCCAESCSVSTLTKYCKPSMSSAPKMPFSEDRDAIFGLKLPLFRPPENFGQYV